MKEVMFNKDDVIVCPTDTLYGICASATSKKSVDRIYEIKGRDENKPFIILIEDLSDLKKFEIKLNYEQKTFLEKVWPSPLSVILSVPQKKFEYLHRGTKALAFRMPKKKSLQEILRKTGPLVAPSANPQGVVPAETIKQAKEYFGTNVDRYIAGGKLTGKPSTLIRLDKNSIEILRQGDFKVPSKII